MTVPLTEFLPLLKAYAPAAPNPVAEQFLRLAARDFCKRTLLWREIVTVTVTANPFSLAPDAYTSVVKVVKASFDGAPLDVAPLSAFDLDEIADQAPPEALISVNESEFRLQPFTAGDLTATVCFAPQAGPKFGVAGATTHQAAQGLVPDALFEDHAATIVHGALAKLVMTPGQPYSDLNAAALYQGLFERAMDNLTTQPVSGKQNAPVRTRAAYF